MVITRRAILPPEATLPAMFETGRRIWPDFEVRGPFEGSPDKELPMPVTDPALWAELGQRRHRPRRAGFLPQGLRQRRAGTVFRSVTMQRVIDKQYSFLWQAMTGQKIYFGDRPRNAHHWMIITHELFDLRQQVSKPSANTA